MGDAFQFGLIPPGSGVLCALSGGADSMYLLCRLLEGRERYGWRVCAAHLNHGLRETAGRDEKFVRDWCGRRGVPLAVGLEDVAGYARREGLSLEEAGRTLRYRFLGQAALEAGCPLIATGHHAGDSAETVLMNLIRGCGLKGLAGIPERRDNIVRPMLEVSRGEIEAYLKEHGVPHVEDETNDDVNYTRNKVRHQLLPLLEELNPQAAAHIAAAARRLREDEEELSRQAAPLAAEGLDIPDGVALPVRVLREAPRPLALRACAGLLERAGLGAQAVHLERVLALALGDDPSAGADLAGGLTGSMSCWCWPLGRTRSPLRPRSCGRGSRHGGSGASGVRPRPALRRRISAPGNFTSGRKPTSSVPAGRATGSPWDAGRKRR